MPREVEHNKKSIETKAVNSCISLPTWISFEPGIWKEIVLLAIVSLSLTSTIGMLTHSQLGSYIYLSE